MYIYIYSLLIKFYFKKLKHMFHKAFKKSFNLQLVDLNESTLLNKLYKKTLIII